MSMKKILTTTILGIAVISGGSVGAYAQSSSAIPFTDVPRTHWAYGSISQLYQAGIVDGVSATRFAPEQPVTNAQYIDLLMETGYQSHALHTIYYIRKPDNPYQDLQSSDWYYDDVIDAHARGFLPDSGKLAPNQPISRAAMAVITAKFYSYVSGAKLDLNAAIPADYPFTDGSDGTVAQQNAALFLQRAGLLDGKPGADGTARFDFHGTLTRAEAAAALTALYDRINTESPTTQPVDLGDSTTMHENGIAFAIEHKRDLLSIVADMGEQPTTGYEVKIEGLTFQADNTIIIRYSFHKPAPGDIEGQIVTHPKDDYFATVGDDIAYHFELQDVTSS